MASLCRQQERGRCENRAIPVYMDGAKASFRVQGRQRGIASGLQGLLCHPKGDRRIGQHSTNRTSPAEGLSRVQVRQGQDNGVDATSGPATGQMAVKGSGQDDTGSLRHSTHIAFHHAGSQYRRTIGGNMRPDMGQSGRKVARGIDAQIGNKIG